MKLKTLKLHVYDGHPRYIDDIYMADKLHSGIVIRSGVCEAIELPKRKRKTKVKK